MMSPSANWENSDWEKYVNELTIEQQEEVVSSQITAVNNRQCTFCSTQLIQCVEQNDKVLCSDENNELPYYFKCLDNEVPHQRQPHRYNIPSNTADWHFLGCGKKISKDNGQLRHCRRVVFQKCVFHCFIADSLVQCFIPDTLLMWAKMKKSNPLRRLLKVILLWTL